MKPYWAKWLNSKLSQVQAIQKLNCMIVKQLSEDHTNLSERLSVGACEMYSYKLNLKGDIS